MEDQNTSYQSTPETEASLTPEPVEQPIPKSKQGLRSVLSTIVLLISAPIVAVLLTAFVFQSYEVDGPSMQETLQNHDRLIVLKVPRTIARITRHNYVPKRGEIIVFVKHNLVEAGAGGDRQLIKRVIGLPGDRVLVQQGTITIYNSLHPDGYEPDKGTAYSQYIETTPGTVDLTVGDDEIFVCGDNRTNSLDSRSFGTVPVKDVVGKLSLRVLPINKSQTF